MDPVTLVVAALVAGASTGVSDTAALAVKDAYAALKAKVTTRLGNGPSTQVVLAEHEADPSAYEVPMSRKLEAAGVAALGPQDPLILAAQQVLAAADPDGARAGRYLVGSVNADRGGVAGVYFEGPVTAGYHEAAPTTRAAAGDAPQTADPV